MTKIARLITENLYEYVFTLYLPEQIDDKGNRLDSLTVKSCNAELHTEISDDRCGVI